MTNFKLFNKESLFRTLVVGAVAGLFASALRIFTSNLVDYMYRWSESEVIRALFYTLSSLSPIVASAVWVGVLALLSNWILYPSYLALSRTIAQSLRLENGNVPALPKQFAELEQQMQNTQKDLALWKFSAQEAERRKDELVVYLAHDIRTPLTSVLGYLELLEESPGLPEESRAKFTTTALRKARRMKSLVEELFEVTRFNIGQIELHKEPVRAGVLLRQLAEEITPELTARGQTITFDIEENTTLFADAGKLARALDNVLHNAVSYAPAGSAIAVACKRAGGECLISISNTGAEISQGELNRYFEKFYRGDTARQSGTGGSGLGLAIAKNIVEAHGGSISAQSADKVTTFLISIAQN